MQGKSLTEQPPTSFPEPAGMSLRDDMALFLSCVAENGRIRQTAESLEADRFFELA